MADAPVLDSYWGQWFATWDEWDHQIDWLFPEGVSVAGVTLTTDILKGLGRVNPNTHVSIALAAAVKQGLGQDRVRAVQDFLSALSPVEWSAKRGDRGGGGSFGDSFVKAIQKPLPDLGALMAQAVIPNGYRVSIRAGVGTQDVINVLHFLGAGPGLEEDLAVGVRAEWGVAGNIFDEISNTAVTLREVEATDLSSTSGGIWADLTERAGTNTQQLATAGAAALVQLNGQTRNRNARGRVYLGPLRENQILTDGRTLDPAQANSIRNKFQGFVTDMAALGFTLQVLSRATNTMYPVNLIRVAPIIATQRRRIRS